MTKQAEVDPRAVSVNPYPAKLFDIKKKII